MSATFSPIPAAAEGTPTLSTQELAGGKPLDNSLSGGFGAALDQAFDQVSLAEESGLEVAPEAEKLLSTIQDLPEGGKLLPLLRQVLDSAKEQGLDPQQILEQIADNLEQLQEQGDLNPAQAAVVALTQILEPQREPGTSAMLAGSVDPDGVLRSGVDPKRFTTEVALSGEVPRSIKADMASTDAPELSQSIDSKFMNSKMTLSEQAVPVAERGQAEAANIMAMMRKYAAEGGKRQAVPELQPSAPVSATASAAIQSPQAVIPASSTLPTVSVDASLNQADWDQAFGEKIQWMVSQRMQGAQIRLNPAHLGPMDVRVQVQNEQATIQFTAAHAVVRDALDAAIPRLREMLGASGVELVDVNVSDQSSSGQQRAAEDDGQKGHVGNFASADDELETVQVSEMPVSSLRSVGQLDIFA